MFLPSGWARVKEEEGVKPDCRRGSERHTFSIQNVIRGGHRKKRCYVRAPKHDVKEVGTALFGSDTEKRWVRFTCPGLVRASCCGPAGSLPGCMWWTAPSPGRRALVCLLVLFLPWFVLHRVLYCSTLSGPQKWFRSTFLAG